MMRAGRNTAANASMARGRAKRIMFWLKTIALTSMTLGSVRPCYAAQAHVRGWYPCMGQPVQALRRRGSCEPARCSSSAAASSSDAAREEESWLTAETQAGAGRDSFMFAPKPLPAGTVLRGMHESDVDSVVGLAFTEYYEGPSEFSAGDALGGFGVLRSAWERAYANGKFEEADVGQLTDWLEMIWLRIMIHWGFRMRVEIGKHGQDHRVFCVSDEKKGDEGSLKLPLAAVAEISLQVPNGRTAPPFPLPLWVKRLMAWPGPVLPYISNVLVHPNVRRRGLANRLMLRCEEQARDWGYGQVYLHVDLSYYPAVRMYETMGYELVHDLEVSFETPRLRYMKKILSM